MIYPSDFYYNTRSIKKDSVINVIFRKEIPHEASKRKTAKQLSSTEGCAVQNKLQLVSPSKRRQVSLWERYCSSSTVHGFKYLSSESDIHWYEKLIWMLLISVAGLGIVYVSYLLQLRFSSNRLATVVESTFYPIYEIPYPAVTICNFNRINGERVDEAIELFLPNATLEATKKLNDVLIGLNIFEFASFDEFRLSLNVNLLELEHINLSSLYRYLIHNCSQMFVKPCWWRNKDYDCCTIFALQKSEYGWCYSFNSETNSVGRERSRTNANYPWRTSSYGDWSGLRLHVNVNESTKMKGINTDSGIKLLVHHPKEWPTTGYFIPAGSQTTVVVKPTISYATSDISWLAVGDRQCLLPEELVRMQVKTLDGLQYMRSNCIAGCHQDHMLSLCNCTMDFLFPTSNYTNCKITDLQCLTEHDDVFNYQKPPVRNAFFSGDQEGMTCYCMHECELITYGIEISQLNMKPRDNSIDNSIFLDIHFQQANLILYRTSLVFDWLDLLVAFGGITGLFLGCSLLSIAEAVLYFAIFLFYSVRKGKRMAENKLVLTGVGVEAKMTKT